MIIFLFHSKIAFSCLLSRVQLANLQVFPSLVKLRDVRATLVFSLTRTIEILNVSVEGLWQVAKESVIVRASWLNTSLDLSFPKVPSHIYLHDVLKHFTSGILWNARSSTLSSAGLEDILRLSVDKLKGEISNTVNCSRRFLFNTAGVTNTQLLGEISTRFSLIVHLRPCLRTSEEQQEIDFCDTLSQVVERVKKTSISKTVSVAKNVTNAQTKTTAIEPMLQSTAATQGTVYLAVILYAPA